MRGMIGKNLSWSKNANEEIILCKSHKRDLNEIIEKFLKMDNLIIEKWGLKVEKGPIMDCGFWYYSPNPGKTPRGQKRGPVQEQSNTCDGLVLSGGRVNEKHKPSDDLHNQG